jgi:DNA-binding XRE family transcriptional regulator
MRRTLAERQAGFDRPVQVTVLLEVGVLVQLDGYAAALGLDREQALREAVGDWVVRRQRSTNRRHRLLVEEAMRQAMDMQPVEEILGRLAGELGQPSAPTMAEKVERFRRQMEATSGGQSVVSTDLCHRGLIDVDGSGIDRDMPTTKRAGFETLRQRREALGLSREKLARVADISSATIAKFEEGARPKESKALELLEAALAEREQVAA